MAKFKLFLSKLTHSEEPFHLIYLGAVVSSDFAHAPVLAGAAAVLFVIVACRLCSEWLA